MAHSHHLHREHQVSHRRVNHILKGEPAGAKQHSKGSAFSKVTSKTAAENHDDGVSGSKAPKRFARGGKVKGHGHHTNIAIVVPRGGHDAPPMAGGLPGGAPPPGMPAPGGPPMPPPGGPPGLPPGMPPGMPMRARGGKVIGGEATEGNIGAWSKRAESNSYFRGGAITGVGRKEKASRMKKGK
jgi:hypothetical protein